MIEQSSPTVLKNSVSWFKFKLSFGSLAYVNDISESIRGYFHSDKLNLFIRGIFYILKDDLFVCNAKPDNVDEDDLIMFIS